MAVGASAALAPGDRLFGGHRAHAHALAQGADPTGCWPSSPAARPATAAGKGGSMHIAAPEVGFVTATGVVAGNIPLALGRGARGRSASDGRGGVAVVSFGDGAARRAASTSR